THSNTCMTTSRVETGVSEPRRHGSCRRSVEADDLRRLRRGVAEDERLAVGAERDGHGLADRALVADLPALLHAAAGEVEQDGGAGAVGDRDALEVGREGGALGPGREVDRARRLALPQVPHRELAALHAFVADA